MTVRILVVSRNKEILNFLRDTFSASDCHLITATDASLALYLAHKNFPDLILCDQEASQLSGIAFVQEIRNDKDLADIPLFAFDIGNGHGDSAVQSIPFPIEGTMLLKMLSPYLTSHTDSREPQTPE